MHGSCPGDIGEHSYIGSFTQQSLAVLLCAMYFPGTEDSTLKRGGNSPCLHDLSECQSGLLMAIPGRLFLVVGKRQSLKQGLSFCEYPTTDSISEHWEAGASRSSGSVVLVEVRELGLHGITLSRNLWQDLNWSMTDLTF